MLRWFAFGFFVLLALGSNAQTPCWQTTFSIAENLDDHRLKGSSRLSDGSLLIWGNEWYDALILKIDAEGKEAWRYRYAAPNNSFDTVDGVATDPATGDVFALLNAGTSECEVAKLRSSDGVELWRRNYHRFLYEVMVPRDGNLFVVGTKDNTLRLFVFSSTTGDIVSTRNLPIPVHNLIKLPGGDLIAQSSSDVVRFDPLTMTVRWKQANIVEKGLYRSGDSVFAVDSGHLTRLDVATGAILWRKEFPPEYLRSTQIAFAGNNDVIECGAFKLDGVRRINVRRFDYSTGNIVWERNVTGFFQSEPFDLTPVGIALPPNGLVVIQAACAVKGGRPGVYGLDFQNGASRYARISGAENAQEQFPFSGFLAADGTVGVIGTIRRSNLWSTCASYFNPNSGEKTRGEIWIGRGPSVHRLVASFEAEGTVNIATTKYSWIFEKVVNGRQVWRTVMRRRPSFLTLFGAEVAKAVQVRETIYAVGSLSSFYDAVAINTVDGAVRWSQSGYSPFLIDEAKVDADPITGELLVEGNAIGQPKIVRLRYADGAELPPIGLPSAYLNMDSFKVSDDGNYLVTGSAVHSGDPDYVALLRKSDGTVVWKMPKPDNTWGFWHIVKGDSAYLLFKTTGAYSFRRVSLFDGSEVWSRTFEASSDPVRLSANSSYVGLYYYYSGSIYARRLRILDGSDAGTINPSVPGGTMDFFLAPDGSAYVAGDAMPYPNGTYVGWLARLDFEDQTASWVRQITGPTDTRSRLQFVHTDALGRPVAAGVLGTIGGDGSNNLLTTVCFAVD